jgi:multicomponent Na+:H+ antiporter subunit G
MKLDIICNIIGNIFLIIGIFTIISSLVGIVRIKDVLSKIHIVGISDVFGYPICYIGLMLKSFSYQFSVKYFSLIVIIMITSPVISHNISKIIFEDSKK